MCCGNKIIGLDIKLQIFLLCQHNLKCDLMIVELQCLYWPTETINQCIAPIGFYFLYFNLVTFFFFNKIEKSFYILKIPHTGDKAPVDQCR